jgi:hypothetical protein
MKPVFVRPASLADARDVAARLREEDRQEVLAAGGLEPRIALPALILDGRAVFAAGIEGGSPEVLFGCDPVEGTPILGIIWMVSTPAIYEHPVEFIRTSKDIFRSFHERFLVLGNHVDARNVRHLRWLEWMGCKMVRRIESFGAQSLPFMEFVSIRPCA